MGFCPKHRTENDACAECDDATIEKARLAGYQRGYQAGKRTAINASAATRAERARCAKEARLAKAASLWMGNRAFDKLIGRIENPPRLRASGLPSSAADRKENDR